VPGDPSSGVLPRISTEPPGEYGAGDKKVQAYCFRMCLTQVPDNRVPSPSPPTTIRSQYELLVRIFDAGWRETFHKFDPIPNWKTDTNNHGPFSTDNIGRNWDYPEASYERRREIIQEHVNYQQGWLYFIANDPRVPEEVRTEMAKWGLAKDEFVDNNNWPHQMYVREARRMVGRYVMTENELLKKRPRPNPSAWAPTASTRTTSSATSRPKATCRTKATSASPPGPVPDLLRLARPEEGPGGESAGAGRVSSSHIAYGSIRMEPVFMILGQSAATAAVMAIDGNIAVQDVPYDKLRERLLADGQVLEFTPPPPAPGAGQVEKGDRMKTLFVLLRWPRLVLRAAKLRPRRLRWQRRRRDDRRFRRPPGPQNRPA
jgi:hypothetical protein